MKVECLIAGDPSVGIPDGIYKLDLGEWGPDDDEHRNHVRKHIVDLCKTMWGEWGGKDRAVFEDECPDCGARMVKNVMVFQQPYIYACHNQTCITNLHEPY